MELEGRAALHAALGEVHRLAICDALVLSDRSPSELGALVGVPSNLLAHHLATLEAAGAVEVVASSGDRRRRYVRLCEPARAILEVPGIAADRIVFVCKYNSARSQIAAALWREQSSTPVASAGTEPAARVHPEAVRVASGHGLDVSGIVPRALDLRAERGLIVTVCDEAHEAITSPPLLGRGRPMLHWSIPDPVASGDRRAFEDAFVEIQERVELLSHALAA